MATNWFKNLYQTFGFGEEDKPPQEQPRRTAPQPQPQLPQTFEEKLAAQKVLVDTLNVQGDELLEKAAKNTDLQNALVTIKQKYQEHQKKKDDKQNKEESPDISDMIIRQFLIDNNRTLQMISEALMQRILSLDGLEAQNDTERRKRKELIVNIQKGQKKLDDLKESLTKTLNENRIGGPLIPLHEHSQEGGRTSYLPEDLPSTFALNSQELGNRINVDGDTYIDQQIENLESKSRSAKKKGNRNKEKTINEQLKRKHESKAKRKAQEKK
jgi:hypothetical protein